MERNTILAIVLSALVLFGYQTIFVAPKQAELAKSEQVSTNPKEIEKTISAATVQSINETKSTNTSVKPIEVILKTTNSEFYFSNVGGSLHNVNFLKNNPFPIFDILTIKGFDNLEYKNIEKSEFNVVYHFKNSFLSIKKNYILKDKNLLEVSLEIKNLSEISSLENINFSAFEIDETRMDNISNNRENTLFEYSIKSNNKIYRKGSANKFNEKSYLKNNTNFDWIGFRDHYHALIVKPEFETKGYEVKADSEKQLNISITPKTNILTPGQAVVYTFTIYNGPQDPWTMKKYNRGFEKIVAFCSFPISEWIGQAIYHIIPFFHSIFKSWGLAIILISFMIYGITYPLTMQSMMSMRKMQEVQPKIAVLRDRYKNDPQKLNTEMMEIYRREKINPFGGCLPFLIQMPFFMALYQILWRAQYFQGQGFLWIKDLSQPDRLMMLPFDIPFLGNELNILPILTGGIMFLQQKISSKSMVAMDEQQAMQQKMMMYILPVMMTFMFYKFASSWSVYFLIFYILSTLTQWKIAKLKGVVKK